MVKCNTHKISWRKTINCYESRWHNMINGLIQNLNQEIVKKIKIYVLDNPNVL